MSNFDSAYAAWEATWRYGPQEDPDQEAIQDKVWELMEDDDFCERFVLEHPGIDIQSDQGQDILSAEAEKLLGIF